MAYDFLVLAGTQGHFGHLKKDRLIALCAAQRIPMVLYCEGGGGRPGDTDGTLLNSGGLLCPTFASFAKLNGRVPLVGVASGYCFAGNAALLGLCDVVIATADANIGMGGPAMISGGGLGDVSPRAIGPAAEHARWGSVDVLAADEAEATAVAKRYLSFFQGSLPRPSGGGAFPCADQAALRSAVPENRVRVYGMRGVIETLGDAGGWLELRRHYGAGIITGLTRFFGRAVGIVANDPAVLGGAIHADGALKAARFMELCNNFGIPLLFLCDCPGFMVGVEHEREAAVRKFGRMFAVGASLSVPFFTIVVRKAYGLGAMAMAGGMMMGDNRFCVAWPSGEMGPMGLEGAVRLGFSKELAAAAAESAAAERALYAELVARSYANGRAANVARTHEIDDVIDPAESRDWIRAVLDAHPDGAAGGAAEDGRRFVSPW